MKVWSWIFKRCSMSAPHQENNVDSKPRARANTSFGALAWRRNKPDSSASVSLASSPAAPIQTLPIDTLIQFLTPPAVPSLNHARSLVTALSTQTPPPPPATLVPILANLCGTVGPSSLHAVGFDILAAYCTCGGGLATSDRLIYFDIMHDASNFWSQEAWESRLKAMNALIPSADEAIGVENKLLQMLTRWVNQSIDDYCSSDVDKQEKERAVEILSDALIGWFDRLESSGRMSGGDALFLFEFHQALVYKVLKLPPGAMQQSPPPALGQRENSSPNINSPSRHRRHPSSATNFASPLSNISPHLQRSAYRNPVHFVASIYLNFLDSQLSHLPPSFLPNLMPLLFRILSSGMSPLPLMSIHTPALFKSQSIEGRVVKTIEALLSGPYTTTCLLLLRKLLSPSLPVDRSTYYDTNPEIQVETSLGALRMLHLQIRRVLEDHMAMRFMQRDMSFSATHAGTPGSTSALDQQFIERAQRAWKMEGAGIWDARTVGFFLCKSIRAWIFYPLPTEKERIFEEVAGLLRDVLQELEDRGEDRATTLDNDFNDNDTAGAVGRALYEMTTYVNTLQNSDGSPMLLPLAHASSASTPLLRILADILGRDHTVYYLNPPLPIILLSVADHLTDADSKKIPVLMVEQHQLKPTSSDWLDNWAKLLGSRNIFVRARPLTRRAVMVSLQSVFSLIKDMPAYRRRLAGVIFDFWMRLVEEGNEGADGAIVWRLLGDEIGLRAVEDDITELFTPTEESSTSMSDITIHKIMVAMMSVSGYCDCDGEVEVIVKPADVVPVSPLIPLTPSDTAVSSAGSPVSSKMATDAHGSGKDKESGSNMQQQIMSLLSFGGSRSQSQYQIPQSQSLEDTMPAIHFGESSPQSTSPEVAIVPCRGLVAVTAFINVFTQLAFVDSVMTERQTSLTIFVFRQLLKLLRTAHCPRARVTILQALMRLRADRDHRIFFVSAPSETENQISSLARLVGRIRDPLSRGSQTDDSRIDETFVDRARAKQIFERDGRRTSRGRGSRAGTGSRSRSRVPGANTVQRMTPVNIKLRDQLWSIPDFVPFSLENAGKGSQLLVSYDPEGPNQSVVLPISDYMDVLVEILKTERDWEVLSYVLVHLPVQLANKHFWCGPFAKESTEKLLSELCKSLTDGTLGKYVPQEEWPGTLKARDAQGLAYHTLTVLISYQSIFDANKRHALVEIFQAGLSGKGETVVVCTHALTLCLFEMETTMVKMLSRILEKFSQIVSNPSMAVHILTFLSILASLPHIYSNFTDNDFKMVFGVALQYLQHHNRVETLSEFQFSLSQHVRIMSYYILYIWFLALKLADRPRHVQFIARQLLLANEGRDEVDDPTEVCFDFLARYTYANADPKPAPSLLGEILSDPAGSSLNVEVVQEKTWIVGFSIVTIRLLAKAGWFEVISRRASGMTKFLCKNENVPLVGLGDMNPDMVTIPTSLMMDKDPRTFGAIITPSELSPSPEVPNDQQNGELMVLLKPPVEVEDESGPDSTTGYVWSATAPSQRRKHVDMDPSYFPLQLSAYPDIRSKGINGKIVRDARALGLTLRTLDLTPVIDTHKVGILYVAPGQTDESKILLNTRGSPAYTRFLKGIGRLIKLRSQVDVYTGGLNPDEDGEYAYAWWDDTGQVLYHTATMMPNHPHDIRCNYKKRHIGNDLVRIVWNDSGLPYRFDTLSSEFQFVNIVIEPHSRGAIAAYANNEHENEYFRLSVQCAEGMAEFAPIGDFKIVSARSLSILVRQISLVADWYASIFKDTYRDTERNEIVTNWRARLEIIKRFMNTIPSSDNAPSANQEIMDQESFRDFTLGY
ncbi:hypothetical protein EW145_g3510 [Phellinidium pouzarii]|uniref:Rap-GAP domain-containing protein n=1 Tax=Phellinidium pouzarii TaxID=167371 RepID=A0A4V3XCU3_9AGAM|nr:hypothetical protein EW145_g3510 [Phellinidium pouzarii]